MPQDPFSLLGNKALLTGARRHVGRGIALALAEAGCDVVVNDLALDERGEETLEMVRAMGREAEFIAADVSDSAQVDAMFESAMERFGRIDILVNNAYAGEQRLPLPELTEEEWDLTLDVTLKGAFLCARAAARHMLARGEGGSIVNVGSVHAERSMPGATCYAAAKAGLTRLTSSIAVDLATQGVRCNAVLPGYMDVKHPHGAAPPVVGSIHEELREVVPMQRLVTPEDIGRTVVYLCSPAAASITGVALPLDGGLLALFPHS